MIQIVVAEVLRKGVESLQSQLLIKMPWLFWVVNMDNVNILNIIR